jgi:hypothetical protein
VAGGAAEMALLGDAPPEFIASDMLSANAVAGIICHTPASRASFIEHCYQEALAIIEQHKHVGLALARALIDHPERTLKVSRSTKSSRALSRSPPPKPSASAVAIGESAPNPPARF